MVNVLNHEGMYVREDYWHEEPGSHTLYGTLFCVPHEILGIKLDRTIIPASRYDLTLSAQSSQTGRHKFRLTWGLTAKVNGAHFMSRITGAAAKHTLNFDTAYHTELAILRFKESYEELNTQVRALRSLKLTNGEAALITMSAVSCGLISMRLGKAVDALWRKPMHEEFQSDNGWTMYFCFSEILKAFPYGIQHKVMPQLYTHIMNPDNRR